VQIPPLSGGSTSNSVWVEGDESARKVEGYFNRVSSGYLKTMGMPLLAGRDFQASDTASAPRVGDRQSIVRAQARTRGQTGGEALPPREHAQRAGDLRGNRWVDA
jgi:hypothetical protein